MYRRYALGPGVVNKVKKRTTTVTLGIPVRREEVPDLVPPVPEGADANGTPYATDRLKGGLYILELTV